MSRVLSSAWAMLAALVSAQGTQFTCSIGSAGLVVDASGIHITLGGEVWLQDSCVGVHAQGVWYSNLATGSAAALIASPLQQISGTDPQFGPYTAATITWTPNVTSPVWSAITTVGCYGSTFLFSTELPNGLLGTATYPSPSDPKSDFDSFNVSYTPVLTFPCFSLNAASPVLDGSLGYIEWAGEFAWHESSFGTALKSFKGGQLGGPLVLFNASEAANDASPQRRALIIGPATNMRHNILAYGPNPAGVQAGTPVLAAGPQGHLTSLPAGYTHRVAVTPSTGGIQPAVYAYGAVLRTAYQLTRLAADADPAVSKLSYWTDNGQMYFGGYWGQFSSPQGANVLLGLQSYHHSAGIPVASYQLDPWWYPATQNGGCAVNWTANANIWGSAGLQPLVDAGMALTLYASMYGVPPDNQMDFNWVTSAPFSTFFNGPIARIAPSDSLAFYTEIMRRCKLWNCVAYEIDFTDFNYMTFPDELQQVGVYEGWMQGLNDAALTAGVSVQLCMSLPGDVLHSVTLPAVTNVRASDDNDFTYAAPDRWTIGQTSMLYGALDIRPFFDGFWTTPHQNTSDNAYGPSYWQNFTEMSAVVSVLSTGPVGIGDHIGYTNGSLVNMTCRADGVLLKPSTAAAPIDVHFAPGGPGSYGAQVYQAFTLIPTATGAGACPTGMDAISAAAGTNTPPSRGCNCAWATLLAVDVATSLTVSTATFTPSLPFAGSVGACLDMYVGVPWSAGVAPLAAACADGAPALSCVFPLNATTTLTVLTGGALPGMHHNMEMYSLAPVQWNGWALVGELGKITRVSPQRVSLFTAASGASDLSFTVTGAPDEAVTMTLLTPPTAGALGDLTTAVMRTVTVTVPAAGSISISCSGVGQFAKCM